MVWGSWMAFLTVGRIMDKTKMAVDIFDKYAESYQQKYMDVGLYHDSLDLFCANIHPNPAKVLDVACGPGNISQYLLKQGPHFQILGIDLAPTMIELAKINNPGAEFRVLDCREITTLPDPFDAIMCGFCLPYLSKTEAIQLIRDAYTLLNPNGLLYISTMEDDYKNSGLKSASTGEQLYMHFHQADYLTAAMEEAGFSLLDVRRQDFPSPDGTKTTDLIILARKIN